MWQLTPADVPDPIVLWWRHIPVIVLFVALAAGLIISLVSMPRAGREGKFRPTVIRSLYTCATAWGVAFVTMIVFFSADLGIVRPVDNTAVVQEWLLTEYGFEVGDHTARHILHPEEKYSWPWFVEEYEGERIRMNMELDEAGEEYRIVDREGRVIPPLSERS
jgi:hypothetical protein